MALLIAVVFMIDYIWLPWLNKERLETMKKKIMETKMTHHVEEEVALDQKSSEDQIQT